MYKTYFFKLTEGQLGGLLLKIRMSEYLDVRTSTRYAALQSDQLPYDAVPQYQIQSSRKSCQQFSSLSIHTLYKAPAPEAAMLASPP